MDASSEVRTYTRRKRQLGPGGRRKKELDGDGVLRFTPFFPLLILHKGTSCGSLQGREGGEELVFVVCVGLDLGLILQI